MWRVFALLLAGSVFANQSPSSNLPFTDSFEGKQGMANTGWLVPVELSSVLRDDEYAHDEDGGSGTAPRITTQNDGLYVDLMENVPLAYLMPVNLANDGDDTLLVRVLFEAAIPVGSIVTGIEVQIGGMVLAFAKDHIPNPTVYPEVIDQEIWIDSGTDDSGDHKESVPFPIGQPTIDAFGVRTWGGQFDDWGPPSIPGAPAEFDSFNVRMRLTNVGLYRARVYFDYVSARVHYQLTPAIIFTGTGTTTATVQRGIPIASALVGSGTTTSAANAVAQVRKITAALTGSGITNASVRKDVGGVISVYGEAHMAGAGTTTAEVQRAIPIPAALTGSGTTAATVQRGIPGKAWSPGPDSAGPDDNNYDVLAGRMAGSATTTATVNRIQKITAAFVGSGTTVVTGLFRTIQIPAAFVGSATTTVAANAVHQIRKIVGAFVGSGVVTATIQRAKQIPAVFVGSGVTTATVQRIIKIIGNFVGSGVTVGEAYSGSRLPAPPERSFVVTAGVAFIVPAIANQFEVSS